jgi:hypothetical protein
MKITLALMLSLLAASAQAEVAGRWLPSGETPSVIEHVYASPRGDLEFLRRGDSHSVLLRNVKGSLAEMTSLQGPMSCDEWFISDKETALPAECEFIFYSQDDGTYLSVKSEEMEESNLFRSVSGSLRGKNVSL